METVVATPSRHGPSPVIFGTSFYGRTEALSLVGAVTHPLPGFGSLGTVGRGDKVSHASRRMYVYLTPGLKVQFGRIDASSPNPDHAVGASFVHKLHPSLHARARVTLFV
jgi:hypothetical protein